MARTEAETNEKPVASLKMRKITSTICDTEGDRDAISGADLVQGRLVYVTSTDRHEKWNGTAWVPVAPAQTNLIVNGSAKVAQRGDGPFTVDQDRPADQWLVQRSGSTFSATRVAAAVAAIPNIDENVYYVSTVVTSVAGAPNFVALTWKVEDIGRFAGRTVCFSFYGKANVAKTVAVDCVSTFGTGGSASVTGAGQTVALTTSWARYQVTFTVPTISGKTVSTDSSLAFDLWFDAGATYATRAGSIGQQSGTFDIALAQLEFGKVASPYVSEAVATTWVKCLRYFYRLGGVANNKFATVAATSTTLTYATIPLPVPMVKTPTVTVTAPTASLLSGTAVTAAAQDQVSTKVVSCTVTVAAGLAAAGAYTWYDTTSTTFVDVAAEL